MVKSLLGYHLFDGTVDDCADQIAEVAVSSKRDCKIIACLNPHSYFIAKEDAVFCSALRNVDWLVPDGSGVLIAARWLKVPLKERVAGPDVFCMVMKRLDVIQGRVFFLGASDDTLRRIEEQAAAEYPKIIVVGTYSPPFKAEFSSEDSSRMIAAVNSARPDVLWVGMTAPKQEKWLFEHRDVLSVKVAGAIGAAFDFYAGTVRRSPASFQSLGLEWLPRLIQQPRRLWRRMFISAPIFLMDVVRERIRRGD